MDNMDNMDNMFLGGLKMDYMTIKTASAKWGITGRRIQVLCNTGRISGVIRFGHAWAIPADAEKPADARIHTGKYVKAK